MSAGSVRDILLAPRLAPERVAELLRPYGFRDPGRVDQDLQAVAGDPQARGLLAGILEEVLGVAAASADADGALSRFERFVRASGSARAVLSHLRSDPRMIDVLLRTFGASPFLAEVLIRHPAWLYWLSEPGVLARARAREEVEGELGHALAPLSSPERRLDALRLAKRREILHVGVRDLLRLASVEETLAALSLFADVLIEAASDLARDALRAELGLPDLPRLPDLPPRGSGPGRPLDRRRGFTVLGLGKLGGGELNFSSDVDLVYVYDTDRGRFGRGPKAVPRSRYFEALSRRVTGALADTTAEGSVYRVDLRLRPEGGAGSVALPLRAFREYYRARGATWERLALLKARPVAGDRALGERFVAQVRPFVFRRGFDEHAVRDVRKMKEQIDRKVGLRAESHRHVKLGVGGIREIELVTQVLQARHGARRPALRARGTLAALHALAEAGLFPRAEHDTLVHGYLFLRDVENKLQMVADAQVHALPEHPEEVRACALRLGYRDAGVGAGDALLADYRRHTEAVRRIFDGVLAG